jgi:hypothetical protein
MLPLNQVECGNCHRSSRDPAGARSPSAVARRVAAPLSDHPADHTPTFPGWPQLDLALEPTTRAQRLAQALGPDHLLMRFRVVSLDSVDEIRTKHACSLPAPDARDTIHLKLALWNAPPAPVVRGRRPAVRTSKSRNSLTRYAPWRKVIRFPEPQCRQSAGSPTQGQPGHACNGSRDDGLCVNHGSSTCAPGSPCKQSTSLRRPFIHAIEGHHPNSQLAISLRPVDKTPPRAHRYPQMGSSFHSISYSFIVRPSAAAPPHIPQELPPAFPWEALIVTAGLLAHSYSAEDT